MSPINEYIVTALIIIGIVVASMTMVTSAVTPLRTVFERERLKMAAEKLLTQILLSAGEPADWGSNASIKADALSVFGLAAQLETTREAYTLDMDKVGRIADKAHPLYVSPQRAIELLNLQNEFNLADYGFSLEIFPVLNISATGIAEKSGGDYNVKLTLKVKNTENQPVVGARLLVKLYWTDKYGLHGKPTSLGTTDGTGSCNFYFSDVRDILDLATGLLIVYADYHGTRNFKVVSLSEIIPWKSQGGPIIEPRTIELRPNARGTYSEWNVTNGLSDWNATGDGKDDTYIYFVGEARKKHTLNLEDFSTYGNITKVTVYARCMATQGGQEGQIILRTYAMDYYSSKFNLKTNWNNEEFILVTNPKTNKPWTWEELGDLEIGILADIEKSNKEARCSELWIKVDYNYQIPTSGKTATAYLVGEKFFVGGGLIPISSTVLEVLPLIKEEEIGFRQVNFSLSSSGSGSYEISYMEPSAIVFLAPSKKGNDYYTVFVSRAVELKGPNAYKTISTYLGEPGKEFPISAYVERVVKIGGCTYIARLYVWRMSY